MSEYKQLESIKKTYTILEFLRDQRRLVTPAEISKSLEIPQSTVMSHLATWEELQVVVNRSNKYGLGIGLGKFWAEIKHRLFLQQEEVDRHFAAIEINHHGE